MDSSHQFATTKVAVSLQNQSKIWQEVSSTHKNVSYCKHLNICKKNMQQQRNPIRAPTSRPILLFYATEQTDLKRQFYFQLLYNKNILHMLRL